jgi:hypothetical protein
MGGRMSWDASLVATIDGNEVEVGECWNYTHNTNAMIAKVLTTCGYEMGPAPFWEAIPGKPSTRWWDHLHGLNGADGEKFLSLIVDGLMEAPELFRKMNPENGWGDYDALLRVLVSMRDASRRFPSANWWASG